MSTSSTTKKHNPNEASQDVSQNTKQRPAIPHIEVVNEIQIIVNKKENQRSVTTPSDSKDIRKCTSSRSSKTDLTAVTTPTTATCETSTTKSVTIKNGRRPSRDKDKGESNSTICVCGKILKRVKGFLEKKEKPSTGELENLLLITSSKFHACSNDNVNDFEK